MVIKIIIAHIGNYDSTNDNDTGNNNNNEYSYNDNKG